MSIIIKKVSKNTVISLISISGIVFFLLAKFFLGIFGLSAQKTGAKADNAITNSNLVSAASADIYTDCWDCPDCCEAQGR